MIYQNETVSDVQIAYIGGGSTGWAWGLMSDLALEPALSGHVKLYDIDHESAKNNEVIGNKLKGRADVLGQWDYEAVGSLKEALTGADFVIISILPGTFEEMASDVHTPEKYGIYQAVGDTVGPGGYIRALRTIPMYTEIAEAVRDYAPKAWVISYTNPMTLCVKTLYHVYPEIKAFGCCHEVFHTQNILTEVVKMNRDVETIEREDIKVNIVGINHFTWLNRAHYKDMDILPLYDAFCETYYETGYRPDNKQQDLDDVFRNNSRVKFDLYKKYGIIAAAGDRHLAEFMEPWYLNSPETPSHWGFALTPVSYRIDNKQKLLEKSQRLVSGAEVMALEPTGEDGVKQMKALLGVEDLVTNINLPNGGQISNLPIGAVVETNARFTSDMVQPVMAGEVPSKILSMVSRHAHNQDAFIEGYFNQDKKQLFTVFMNDPLVTITATEGKALFDEMIDKTKAYLEDWLLD